MATSLHVYPPAQPMEENRKAARFAVRVPLRVCATRDGLPEFRTGRLRDISRTGILFYSQVTFEVGTELE
jgi:PilZ domain